MSETCYVERDERGRIWGVGDIPLKRRKGLKYTVEDRDTALTEYQAQIRDENERRQQARRAEQHERNAR